MNIVDSEDKCPANADQILATNKEEVLTNTDKMDTSKKTKVLEKLHKQFGRASADKLQRLLNSSGNKNTECINLLQKVIGCCEACQKYCKTKPKPAVGLPLAST